MITSLSLSQDEIARKAYMLYMTLTKIDTVVIKKASVDEVAKIEKVLNILIEELI